MQKVNVHLRLVAKNLHKPLSCHRLPLPKIVHRGILAIRQRHLGRIRVAYYLGDVWDLSHVIALCLVKPFFAKL